jgi:dihydrodipicolinate synthase/N-acetylneuraminate lyase
MIEAPNIIGIKSGTNSTYHTQNQAHSHNHNSLVGSNASLMSNFNKAGATLTSGAGASIGPSSLGSIGGSGGPANHLKNSTSKGKN